ncbi:hypothetical protein [Steroidobacter sp.]|uniref:hypothetical protein n=1 Tax=Steroidobacter sp. TaxID=1978227 RepID=UPI001A4EE116|nr:hypothetical protein [Steroidobacter sp.]MBL8272106.1 hypothetical protein [Steroidobacter sp.]
MSQSHTDVSLNSATAQKENHEEQPHETTRQRRARRERERESRESEKPRKTPVCTPVLDLPLLDRIYHLNLDYLDLLVSESTAPAGATQLQHLQTKHRAALCALPRQALKAVAEVPYTLYSLGFEEEGFWDSVCTAATAINPSSVTQRYSPGEDTSAQCAFCEVALLYAWHVVATNMMAARVTHAMPAMTASRLAKTPLWEIKRIAASHEILMMPRWPTNPAFWPDLIRFAASNDTRRLTTTRLLGTQLIAAELEVACPLSRREPRSGPYVPSPRLRARKLQMERHLAPNKSSVTHERGPA